MTEPEPYLLPPPGTDHAELAMRATEAAIDLAAAAEGLSGPAAAALWHQAADHHRQARMHCLEAAAAIEGAERRDQEALGRIRCPRCGRWRCPEEMEAQPVGYVRKGAEEMPPSVYYSCAGGCE